MEVLTVLLCFAVIIGLLLGFHALDRWHKRKAWREADASARSYMAAIYGVHETAPGQWEKIGQPKKQRARRQTKPQPSPGITKG